WDDGGHLSTATTQHTGSRITGSGDVSLQAGNQLGGASATIASQQGNINIAAANNIELRVDQNTYSESGRASNFTSQTSITRHTRSEEHTSELQSRENLVCR